MLCRGGYPPPPPPLPNIFHSISSASSLDFPWQIFTCRVMILLLVTFSTQTAASLSWVVLLSCTSQPQGSNKSVWLCVVYSGYGYSTACFQKPSPTRGGTVFFRFVVHGFWKYCALHAAICVLHTTQLENAYFVVKILHIGPPQYYFANCGQRTCKHTVA